MSAVRRRPGGFTLMEILVVFVILALTTAVALPAWRRWIEEDDMTVATRRIEALFRLARDSAIRGGLPVTVVIDSVSSRVWLDAPRSVRISDSTNVPVQRAGSLSSSDPANPGESLELPSSVSIELTRARARFQFTPTGAAFADSLVLRTPLGIRLMTVDPWTGDAITH